MDERLYAEKKTFYRGRAKVNLRNFDLSASGPRTIREKHIASLVETFKSEGCIRLNADNFVQALVSNVVLEQSLHELGLNATDLFDQSRLHFVSFPEDFKLNLLHGKHRLLAADRYLCDKWWVAEFYCEELSSEAQKVIREEHPNARPYCDGDIYRYIRMNQRLGDVDAELKWRGRLGEDSAKGLLRLEKDFRRVQGALDRLLPFKGLWEPLKLSYLGEWMSVKCPEEIFHYLNVIYDMWTAIMGNQPSDLLDTDTVSALETLMPSISLHDRATIRDMMRKGKIFPLVSSPSDRSQLLDRINHTKGRILSLHTFSKDFIYFGACAKVLKYLCQPASKGTIFETFQKSYDFSGAQAGTCRIQVGENCFEDRPGDTGINSRLGYQQLFLAVMRDFPTLTKLQPYCRRNEATRHRYGFAPERQHKLAETALKLGFKTESISKIISRARDTPYEMATREYLDQLQPPDRYIVNYERKHEVAHYVAENISTIAVSRLPREDPEFTTDLENQPKTLRCSRPSYSNYEHDRNYLFIDIISDFRPVPRAYSTSLAIQRDIFVSFFGEFEPPRIASHGQTNDSYPSYQSSVQDIDQEELPVGDSNAPGPNSVHDQPSIHGERSSESSFETDSISTTSISGYGANFLDPQAQLSAEFPGEEVNFPDDDSEFQSIAPHVKPSDLIKELLSSEESIILYIWDSRKYAKFSSNPDEKPLFIQVARMLATQGHVFYGARHDGRPFSIPLRRLYETAMRERLVLIGPRWDHQGTGHLIKSRLEQGIYRFLDEYQGIQPTWI